MRYKRVLLKLSGEALMGEQQGGIDPSVLQYITAEITALLKEQVQLALVIGGGNIFRGVSLAASGMNRVTADHMGMLATVMNALALKDALKVQGINARMMSALAMPAICESFDHNKAIALLEQGSVVIFAAGTGNPFFTTDSAASLRSIEIQADILVKATQVDGVYSADPLKDSNAVRYDRLDYDQVLEQKLAVMDATAIVLCRDHNMPLRVYDMSNAGALMKIIQGENIGTLVHSLET